MAQPTPLFVGLDVHKDSLALAHAQGQSTDPPVFVGAIGTRQSDIEQMVRRLESKTPALVFADEAGPTGYGCIGTWPDAASSVAWSRPR